MTGPLALRGGRVIDPANGLDAVADVLIADGRVAKVGPGVGKDASRTIDASGLVVCPGFVDIHTHLREPGFEHKETIASGTLAAARGGFTTGKARPGLDRDSSRNRRAGRPGPLELRLRHGASLVGSVSGSREDSRPRPADESPLARDLLGEARGRHGDADRRLSRAAPRGRGPGRRHPGSGRSSRHAAGAGLRPGG